MRESEFRSAGVRNYRPGEAEIKLTIPLLIALLLTPLAALYAADVPTVAPMARSAELTRCNAFNDPEIAWQAVAAGAESPLVGLVPPVLLPDGRERRNQRVERRSVEAA